MAVIFLSPALESAHFAIGNQAGRIAHIVAALGDAPVVREYTAAGLARTQTHFTSAVSDDEPVRLVFGKVQSSPAPAFTGPVVRVTLGTAGQELIEFNQSNPNPLGAYSIISGRRSNIDGLIFQAPSTLPKNSYADPLTLTTIGRYLLPVPAGNQNMTYSEGALCKGPGNSFYVGGRAQLAHTDAFHIGRIQPPGSYSLATNPQVLPSATTLEYSEDAFDGLQTTIYSPENQGFLSKLRFIGMVDDGAGSLLMNAVVFYPGGGPQRHEGTHFKRSSTLSATGTTVGPYRLDGCGTRESPGAMVRVPAALQSAYSWPGILTVGSSGLSNNQDICNGPGFLLFNSVDLTGAAYGSKPCTRIASYLGQPTFAEANGAIWPSTHTGAAGENNKFWTWIHHVRGGAQFFNIGGSWKVAYFGFRGASHPYYSTGGVYPQGNYDPTNRSGGAPRAYPYVDFMRVFEVSDLRAHQLAGTAPNLFSGGKEIILPPDPFNVPPQLAFWGAHPAPSASYMITGSAVDDSGNLHVMRSGSTGVVGVDGRPIITVYGVA